MIFIGDLAAKIIVNRTRTLNLSARGGGFKPYSGPYAKRKGVAPTAVDLTVTGDMLNSIMVRNGDGVSFDPKGVGSKFRGQPGNSSRFVAARDVAIEVGPTGARNIGLAQIHNRNRPFMMLTEQEQDELTEEFSRSLHQVQDDTQSINLNITLG